MPSEISSAEIPNFMIAALVVVVNAVQVVAKIF
jgi:hypothetical protein